jgi:hypothetical protein
MCQQLIRGKNRRYAFGRVDAHVITDGTQTTPYVGSCCVAMDTLFHPVHHIASCRPLAELMCSEYVLVL